jgi:hypothetical protein
MKHGGGSSHHSRGRLGHSVRRLRPLLRGGWGRCRLDVQWRRRWDLIHARLRHPQSRDLKGNHLNEGGGVTLLSRPDRNVACSCSSWSLGALEGCNGSCWVLNALNEVEHATSTTIGSHPSIWLRSKMRVETTTVQHSSHVRPHGLHGTMPTGERLRVVWCLLYHIIKTMSKIIHIQFYVV